ncbi:hypothetical protein BMF90_05825 [Serratia sp. OLHL2]|uniref:hypothetical protein n=1 Tax=Serratia TaxID=613 RepID=UPI000C1A2C57|nr:MULTISPECIES: hypothetical protein [Serratia]MBH2664934.1 hypothetical protein [Serratia ureilytica]MBH3008112.1 hypothetical protein [Serratia ureilytica]MBN5282942.1 hypothetical protein [Serratia ureilytica]MBN5370651.1 hypothetical protein [Serratia ureilytica]MDK7595912.1 hypothetical protein [Serratia ureilytica]
MKQTIASAIVAGIILAASPVQAGFNGQSDVQGNQGNNNVGVCIEGKGPNAGQCVGEINGVSRPKGKEQSDLITSICQLPFMKKYAAICQ